MNKLEGLQSYGLPPLPAEPALSRLALLRREREQRRRRARWLANLLLVMGLAFVAQGFVREQPASRQASAKTAKPRSNSDAQPRPAQPQAHLQPPSRS